MSFGKEIYSARVKLSLSQKELAMKIIKNDGTPISPQYLNDLEHDRRYPPSEEMLKQFASVLKLDSSYLQYLAGNFPSDIKNKELKADDFQKAIKAFRRSMNEKK